MATQLNHMQTLPSKNLPSFEEKQTDTNKCPITAIESDQRELQRNRGGKRSGPEASEAQNEVGCFLVVPSQHKQQTAGWDSTCHTECEKDPKPRLLGKGWRPSSSEPKPG